MDPDRPGTGLGRRLLVNTLHAASGRLATMLVWVVFTPAILRALGTERFAIWSLFYALTGYLGALDFGLMQGTLRGVAAAHGRGDQGAAGAFATLGLLGYLILAMLWLVIAVLAADPVLAWLRIPPALEGSARFAIMLGALAFLLSGIANVAMAAAQGLGRFDLANVVLLFIAAEQAAGLAVVLRSGWGLEALLINVVVGWLVGGIAGALLLARGVPGFEWSGPLRALRALREMLRFGVPVQAASVLGVFNAQMDKLLLARFVKLAVVTPYELGMRVAVTATSLPQLLLVPVMREAAWLSASGSPARMRELFDRASRYYLAATALSLAPLLSAAPRLFAAWLGSPQPEPTLVLCWLAIVSGIALGTGLASAVVRGMARTEIEAAFGAATVGLHLVLSLMWIPRAGLRGALVAALVSQIAGALVFMVMFARMTRWPLLSVVLRPWFEPTVAVASGWAAAAALDRLLPTASGAAGLPGTAAVALLAALVALGVMIATRYLPWREAWALLAAGR
jgi:O-antigen/teichoic acid export membrane protein